MGEDIDALIDEIIVDAYGEDEQLWSFRQAFEDTSRFPFRMTVVGVDVTVTEVDFDGDARRGLVAICHRAGESYTVSLLDITPTGPLSLETRQPESTGWLSGVGVPVAVVGPVWTCPVDGCGGVRGEGVVLGGVVSARWGAAVRWSAGRGSIRRDRGGRAWHRAGW